MVRKKKQSGAGIGLISMETTDAFQTNDGPAQLKQKGDFLQSQGKLAEAISCYQEAVQQNPGYAEAFNNMGIAYKNQNRLVSAVVCYREALKVKPGYAAACNNLANALREQGKLNEAKKLYQEALKFKPDFAEAYNNLGNVLRQKGQINEAIINYQSALKIKSDYAEAHNNLGSAFQDQKAFSRAIECYHSALKYNPNSHTAFNNLGNAYQKQGRLNQAIVCYYKAVALRPDYFEAFNSLANALVEFGKIPEAIKYYGKALEINPAYTVAHSNLLLSLHYQPSKALSTYLVEVEKWWQQHAVSYLKPIGFEHQIVSPKRLKIGYVSPDFYQHSVSFFFLPLIQSHDRNQVEIFCYSEVRFSDYLTDKIKKLSDHWRPTIGFTDDEVAEQVRSDGIDILVDLAGHTAGNRLPIFARKPAPVQITWLGYPNTTGMPVMDYRLTDDIADPVGEEDKYHSETLIRLPGGFLCYRPPDDAPDVSGLPARQTGRITFGSFNNLPKINEAVIALWSRLLLQVPESGLLLKSRQFADEHVRQRFLGLFSANRVASERIRLLPRTPSTAGHLASYHKVDIGLDPFPYNGTTTTCEALWMGVPVITLRGDRHAGRVGASILTRVGLEELIAESEAQYVEIGMKLAINLNGLEMLRAGMRARMKASALCDGKSFARTMENSFQMVWKNWCQKNDPE
jgi:predicted O-linked N-acetylglucosamine transferase (SPINDLY family)